MQTEGAGSAPSFSLDLVNPGGGRPLRCNHPRFQLTGWFIPPPGVELNGIRATRGSERFQARRKQLRLDAAPHAPGSRESLHCGFRVDLRLKMGRNDFVIQFKDNERKWNDFAECSLYLPFWWPLTRFRRSANDKSDPYSRWFQKHEADLAESTGELTRTAKDRRLPLISLLVPVYNPPRIWFKRMIESVRQQTYPHWELCMADDLSPDPAVREIMREAAAKDPRIKIVFRKENGHICDASNSALELCTGEFTGLLDHDDELSPHALAVVANAMEGDPDTDLWFSDEDKIAETGRLSDPYFKPGWSLDLLYQQNCFSHFGVFRTRLIKAIGGFRPGLEGSQDWDLTLRAIEVAGADKVRHIPAVLYHWRTLASSTASSMETKPYARSAGRRAVEEHLGRCHPGARLVDAGSEGRWRVEWPLPDPLPAATIIIPTHLQLEYLSRALDTIARKTDYPNYSVLIVDHLSRDPETIAFLAAWSSGDARHAVIREGGEFNWARLNNLAAREARGEVLVFLNNDTEVVEAGWLRELVAQVSRPDVGVAGACLVYPCGTIQHAGCVLGMHGIAGHVFRHGPADAPSIGGAPYYAREVSAVTGACMAVRRAVFEKAGGFDAEHLWVNYNDIDFCLRTREMGLKVIYTPAARLVHHESISRARSDATSERKGRANHEGQIFFERWRKLLEADPFFNRHLSRASEWPVLGDPPPR